MLNKHEYYSLEEQSNGKVRDTKAKKKLGIQKKEG
jgi:hypothetical protein